MDKIDNNFYVIGSGISGLSISKMLFDGGYEVLTFEKESKIGGLVKCDSINGNLFHRVGGHVFNSKNQLVLDWFWRHFDKSKEFLAAKRNAKILLANNLIGYPIENFLFQLDTNTSESIIEELLVLNNAEGNKSSSNFEEFLLNHFGETLYETYFKPYNAKIWNFDLKKIPLEWLEGKLPMPNIGQIFKNNIIRNEEKDMVHSTFWYPRKGGSQFIANRIAEKLNIRINASLNKIDLHNRSITINNEEFQFGKLIYTGDIRKLSNIIGNQDPKLFSLLRQAGSLVSNGTSNVLCECDKSDLSWLYLPEKNIKAHRIIYTGNFSPDNNSSNDRITCTVEFSGKLSQNDMIFELSKLPGNLVPISFNFEPNSYVIQTENSRKLVTAIKTKLLKYNVFLLGRFAEWEYYNMDVCIEASMKLYKELVGQYE